MGHRAEMIGSRPGSGSCFSDGDRGDHANGGWVAVLARPLGRLWRLLRRPDHFQRDHAQAAIITDRHCNWPCYSPGREAASKWPDLRATHTGVPVLWHRQRVRLLLPCPLTDFARRLDLFGQPPRRRQNVVVRGQHLDGDLARRPPGGRAARRRPRPGRRARRVRR